MGGGGTIKVSYYDHGQSTRWTVCRKGIKNKQKQKNELSGYGKLFTKFISFEASPPDLVLTGML